MPLDGARGTEMTGVCWCVQVFGNVDHELEARKLIAFSDVIFLGVKPLSLEAVLGKLSPYLNGEQLIVSIAAGWTLDHLEAALPHRTPVRRQSLSCRARALVTSQGFLGLLCFLFPVLC
jgi:hypothetical protein